MSTGQQPLRSTDDLRALTDRIKGEWDPDKARLRVCITGCRAFGALELVERIKEEIEARGVGEEVELVETGCHGFCSQAPVMEVDPYGYFYCGVTPEDVPRIVEAILAGGRVVEELLYTPPGGEEAIEQASEVPFYKAQRKTVLRNCGKIDPRNVEHYLRCWRQDCEGGVAPASRRAASGSSAATPRGIRST